MNGSAGARLRLRRSASPPDDALMRRMSTALPHIHYVDHQSTHGIRCRIEGLLAARNQEAGGRHLLFGKTYERLQRARTLIPPLPRNHHTLRSGTLHPLGRSKDLSHSRARPLSLGSCEGYNPSLLLPSALVLNQRNTFSVDNFRLNRPKVNHSPYNLLTIKDIQKGQGSYRDPMAGASHAFLHRVSELSSMEADTARQEKLRKNSKNRKQGSY